MKTVTVPDIKYKSIKEAEKQLKELGLKVKVDTNNEDIDKESIITSQIPSGGIQVNEGSTVKVNIK